MPNTTPRARALGILLVEDNPADIRLTREALRACETRHELYIALDGGTALTMLRREAPFQRRPEIDLVLLDLNLPGLNGVEVLSQIKEDPAIAHVPVLALSTSGAERDVAECYRRHVNCYLQKPATFEEFAGLMRSVAEFWMQRVLLLSGAERADEAGLGRVAASR